MKTRNRFLALLLAALMLAGLSGMAFANNTIYTVTLIQSAGGTATVSTNTSVAGVPVTINASAFDGYRFVGWTVTGAVPVNANQTLTNFVMPAGNVTVTANFVPTYSVISGTVGGGTVESIPQYPIAGERVTLTARPLDGYVFSDWSSPSGVSFSTPTYYTTTFIMPASNVNVVATFYKSSEGSSSPSAPIAPAPEVGATFTDVRTSDWFHDDVMYVYEKGLMNGTSGKIFSPKASLTRAMLVTVLYRLDGSPAVSGASGFSDVASGCWYANAVTWAKNNRIVNGTSASTFAPNAAISREQIATILYRYAEYKYYSTSVGAGSNIMGYEDFYSISSYAYDGLYWACSNGVITGNNNYLLPQKNATRAEIAAILHRFCNKYGI